MDMRTSIELPLGDWLFTFNAGYYIAAVFMVIGYHNSWVSFIRYVGISMVATGIACVAVAIIKSTLGLVRYTVVSEFSR